MTDGIEKLGTFIEGFDEVINGGIPKGHIVVITGTPGTMKSSLTLYILHNNMLKNGLKTLYISVEETRESLLRAKQSLGLAELDDKKFFIVDVGKLRLEHSEADEARDWFKILKEYIARRVKEESFDIVAIDSLTALYSLTEVKNPRQELFHFFGFLRSLNVTVFLITEAYSEQSTFALFREDYLADTIFHLKYHQIGDTDMQLRIRCVKMRHTKIYSGYHTLIYRDNKFIVTRPITE